jgi:hypothetical protein
MVEYGLGWLVTPLGPSNSEVVRGASCRCSSQALWSEDQTVVDERLRGPCWLVHIRPGHGRGTPVSGALKVL